MAFYEVIYEPGSHSVASYKDDEEALEGIKAHHDRAVNGQEGGPTNHPAERVTKVLVYDEHPASYGESQMLDTKDVLGSVKAFADEHGMGGMVSVPELIAHLRSLTDPVKDSAPHDANYKMPFKRELDLSGVI